MRLLVHRRNTIRNYRIIGGCGEFATYSRAALRLLCVRLGEVQGSSHEQEAYILHDAAATAASWTLPLTLPLLCLGALQNVSFRSLVTARACPSREHRRPVASRSARVLQQTGRILPDTQTSCRLGNPQTPPKHVFRMEERDSVLCACGCEISNASFWASDNGPRF